MVLLAAGFAALAWERLQTLPYHLGPMAVGILALSVLLAVYAYGRRREVVELKQLLQGLQEHVSAAPSEDQLDQLNDMIARSQRSFKELIDSIDEAACAAGSAVAMRLRTLGWATPKTAAGGGLRPGKVLLAVAIRSSHSKLPRARGLRGRDGLRPS